MNNENSSKQVLLSVIGIAILVVAVVGVSFAFFNYSKEGQYSNVVTTGSVFFNFTDGDAILLENQFPVSDATGQAYKKADGAKDVLSFDVTGWDTSSKGIDYTIYGVKGDIPTQEKDKLTSATEYVEGDRLADQDIKLTFSAISGTDETTTVSSLYATPKTVKAGIEGGGPLGTTTADGCKLATGKIPSGTSEEEKKTIKFELRMWISDEQVLVVGDGEKESEAQKSENAQKSVYGETEFAKKFYSLKILIDAKTATAGA